GGRQQGSDRRHNISLARSGVKKRPAVSAVDADVLSNPPHDFSKKRAVSTYKVLCHCRVGTRIEEETKMYPTAAKRSTALIGLIMLWAAAMGCPGHLTLAAEPSR